MSLVIKNKEMNIGARRYDPEIGRFLSVDPLLEAFPNQSPYSYSFNNPLSYRDPSGLAPEKEKGGKNQIQMNMMEEIAQSWRDFEAEMASNSLMMYSYLAADDWGQNPWFPDAFKRSGGGSSGGGGGSSSAGCRLGLLGTFLTIDQLKDTDVGGISLWNVVLGLAASKFTFNFHYGATLPNGMTKDQAISKFFGSIDDEVMYEIAKSDLRYEVNFANTSDLTNRYNEKNGTEYTALMGFSSPIQDGVANIWISTEMFWDKAVRPNFKYSPQELHDVFHHEWGHSWLKFTFPDYNNFNDDIKEVMADEISDTIRMNNNQIPIHRTEFKRLHGLEGYPFYKNEKNKWNPFRR
ncbi:MAG: hypothetical protein A2X64_00435 [Ignavibacteria bacterium GWF2_33_9]|nr:MAG: hypothetical protein A2X64_00435 [Ignavibacteria bacterium GWF2_33_9]